MYASLLIGFLCTAIVIMPTVAVWSVSDHARLVGRFEIGMVIAGAIVMLGTAYLCARALALTFSIL